MTDYPVHSPATAPRNAQPLLAEIEATFGLIPNIAGAMAQSPELLGSFWGLFRAVHSGSFTEAEIQTLLLTNAVTNGAPWAVAFHSMLAGKEGLSEEEVAAIRRGASPAEPRRAALSAYARGLITQRGHVGPEILSAFLEAGFSRAQSLEVLAVTVASTITNYTASLASPPLEDFLQPYAWNA